MKTFARILSGLGLVAFTAVFGLACMTPVDPEPEDIMSEDDELSGEENIAEAADAIDSCHAPTTCPNPASCAGWSTSYACGTFCGFSRACGGCGPIQTDPECIPDGTPGQRTKFERFRTCTLQNGTSCTEYSVTMGGVTECGCDFP
jgi:hypothetical protein